MDDKQNENKNQPDTSTPQSIQPEEVAPEIEHPEEIAGSIPPEYPTSVPVYEENTNKLPFIIGIILFFIVVFGAVYWFFLKDRLFPPDTTDGEAGTKVALTYWGLWDEKEVFAPLIEAYEKDHPGITITYEKMVPDQYRARLIARSQAGNGPDIFRFHNTWLPQLQEVIAQLPAEIMTPAVFESTFYPIHAKDLKVGGAYYGIPLMVDGTVLIYNDALLKQAGILSPPAVWVGDANDVISVVNALTVKEGPDNIITSGMAIGTADNIDHFGEIYGILLLLNGGDLKDLTTNEAAEALQLYRRFAEDGNWNEQMPNSIAAFIQGKAAMIIGPSWQIINIKAQNPDLKIGVAPIPKGLDNKAAAVSNYWVEGVNRFSQHQTEAWEFLTYLSQKEQLTKMYEMQSKTRLFGVPYPRQDMAPLMATNEYLAPVVAQAKDDVYVSLPLVDRTFDDGMDDEILQYIHNAIQSTAEGVDYGAALQTAHQGISSVLERYKIE